MDDFTLTIQLASESKPSWKVWDGRDVLDIDTVLVTSKYASSFQSLDTRLDTTRLRYTGCSARTSRAPTIGSTMSSTAQAKCNINDVVDYVIGRFADEPGQLVLLKLQNLLFYVQAWRLALRGETLFNGRFQAWVHGPVNRQIYDRFRDMHSLYAAVGASDIRKAFNPSALTSDQRSHIDEILEAYGGFTGTQLEEMTHGEEPWIQARGGLKDFERCETEIDEGLMGSFYSALLKQESGG